MVCTIVVPAEAGTQRLMLDSGFRQNDEALPSVYN